MKIINKNAKHFLRKRTKNPLKYIIIILVWLTASADLITFYLTGNYSLETNIIYLMTGSIQAAIFFKIAILILWSVIFLSLESFKWLSKGNINFLYYLLSILGIALIVMQTSGAISNLNISEGQPLPQDKALKSYLFRYTLPYLTLIISAILIYFVHKRVKNNIK